MADPITGQPPQQQFVSGGHQARLVNDTPWYNANRDVAHNFTKVAELVARRFDQRRWPSLEKILEHEGTDDGDLSAALITFIDAVGQVRANPKEQWFDLLDRCGWFKSPPAAQVAVMAMLGTIYAGMAFQGVREATIDGRGPALSSPELAQAALAACETLLTPRWRRPWLRLCRRWRQFKHAMRQPAP